jgi:hypothetical protein
MRSNPQDVQFLECPAYLRSRQRLLLLARLSFLIPSYLGSGLKQGSFVGVEAQGPAMLFQVTPQQSHILFGGVVPHKTRMETAGGIVDHADQVQFLATLLQPGVLAGVPLHQFALARSAWPPFVDLLDALLAGSPKLPLDHPTAHRFAADSDAVFLAEILAGQCRSEPAIQVLLQNLQRCFFDLCFRSAVG